MKFKLERRRNTVKYAVGNAVFPPFLSLIVDGMDYL